MQVMISCPSSFLQLAPLVTLCMIMKNKIVTFSVSQPVLHMCPRDVKLGGLRYTGERDMPIDEPVQYRTIVNPHHYEKTYHAFMNGTLHLFPNATSKQFENFNEKQGK